jgi:hypothetical protein
MQGVIQSSMEIHHALLNLQFLFIDQVVNLQQLSSHVPSKAQMTDVECLHGL